MIDKKFSFIIPSIDDRKERGYKKWKDVRIKMIDNWWDGGGQIIGNSEGLKHLAKSILSVAFSKGSYKAPLCLKPCKELDPHKDSRPILIYNIDRESSEDKKILYNMFEELGKLSYIIGSPDSFERQVFSFFLECIPKLLDENYKYGLIMSMAIKGNRAAIPTLLEEYKKRLKPIIKQAIGYVLWVIGDPTIADKLIECLEYENTAVGVSTMLWALGATKNRKAIPILLKYLNAQQVSMHALEGLSYFDDPRLIPKIQAQMKWFDPSARMKSKRIIARLKKLGK